MTPDKPYKNAPFTEDPFFDPDSIVTDDGIPPIHDDDIEQAATTEPPDKIATTTQKIGINFGAILRAAMGPRNYKKQPSEEEQRKLERLLANIEPTSEPPEKRDIAYWLEQQNTKDRNIDVEILAIKRDGSVQFTSMFEEEITAAITIIHKESRINGINILDLRKPETQTPKTIGEWNALQPICILQQGQSSLKNALGAKLADEILENGNGLIIFEKAPDEHDAFKMLKIKMQNFIKGSVEELAVLEAFDTYLKASTNTETNIDDLIRLLEISNLSTQGLRIACFGILKICKDQDTLEKLVRKIAKSSLAELDLDFDTLPFDEVLENLTRWLGERGNTYYLTVLTNALKITGQLDHKKLLIPDEEVRRVIIKSTPVKATEVGIDKDMIMNQIISEVIASYDEKKTNPNVKNDINYRISEHLVRNLYFKITSKQLDTLKGRRALGKAGDMIYAEKSKALKPKLGRKPKDEELKIDKVEIETMAIYLMMQENGGSTIQETLQAAWHDLDENKKESLVTAYVSAHAIAEPLCKPISLLYNKDYDKKGCRFLHNMELMEALDKEDKICSNREIEQLHELIKKIETGTEEVPDIYILILEIVTAQLYNGITEESGERHGELCMPTPEKTMKEALKMLQSKTPNSIKFKSDLMRGSLEEAHKGLKAIERYIKINMNDVFFSYPPEPILVSYEDIIDQDILDSPLTTALCLMKIATTGLKWFTNTSNIIESMAKQAKSMSLASEILLKEAGNKSLIDLDENGDVCAIPEKLPMKLAEMRRKYANGKDERIAILNLDLQTHQTPYAA